MREIDENFLKICQDHWDSGALDIIIQYVKEGADVWVADEFHNSNCLNTRSRNACKEVIFFLIEFVKRQYPDRVKEFVNRETTRGWTPLQVTGNLHILCFLIYHGAEMCVIEEDWYYNTYSFPFLCFMGADMPLRKFKLYCWSKFSTIRTIHFQQRTTLHYYSSMKKNHLHFKKRLFVCLFFKIK